MQSFQVNVDLATERERQLMTARANQTTGSTNGGQIVHRKSSLVFSARFPVVSDVLISLLN